MRKQIIKLILLAFLLTCTFEYFKVNPIWNSELWMSYLTNLVLMALVFVIVNKVLKVKSIKKEA